MINSIQVALLDLPSIAGEISDIPYEIHKVRSTKDLVALLLVKKIDLIVLKANSVEVSRLNKIFKRFNIPFAFYGEGQNWGLGGFRLDKDGPLLDQLNQQMEFIKSYQVARENQQMRYIFEGLKKFTHQVVRTTKDLFISEAKKFFSENFKMESSHWVEVKEYSSKLPPILKLRQQLEAQKVNQSSLIADLDECHSEVFKGQDIQVWRHANGRFMAFLWIPDVDSTSQCLILNQVSYESLIDFAEFLNHLIPFLQRRWSLCVTVENTQRQIYRDSLTDLYNQRFLSEVMERKIEEYRRYKTPFSILFIDVDHFKKVNDNLGHLIGSAVLKELGGLLQEQIRTSDFAFRYGGDEFIVLLSHTEGDDSYNVAERIRKKVEESQFHVKGQDVKITVSIGLSFFPLHAQSADEIIRIADEAMYYGKSKSRNIVYKAS